VVASAAGAELVVVGAGPGEAVRAQKACWWSGSARRSLRTNRATTTFFLPDCLVTGELPA
jgi:hypothetical protein